MSVPCVAAIIGFKAADLAKALGAHKGASFMKTCFNVRRDPERSDDMGKRKARTSAKPRSAMKTRSKVKRAKPIARHNSRARSMQAAVMALLNRKATPGTLVSIWAARRRRPENIFREAGLLVADKRFRGYGRARRRGVAGFPSERRGRTIAARGQRHLSDPRRCSGLGR
jgi:hypothetical protein